MIPTLIYLVFETARQHLVGLVKTENFDVVSPESPAIDHVEHTTWGTYNDLHTLLKFGHVLTNIGTTDTGMTFDVHVVAKGDNNLLNLLGQFASGGKDKRLSSLDGHVQLYSAVSDELAEVKLGIQTC